MTSIPPKFNRTAYKPFEGNASAKTFFNISGLSASAAIAAKK